MRYPEGLITWVDLSTTDVAAAKAFYAGLFGWRTQDLPTPVGTYTMCLLGDQVVAGMGAVPPGGPARSNWNCYVNVADANAVLDRVAAAGGQVLMPADDVMDQGRMAVVADPTGAVIGLWQPGVHEGADVFNVPGALVWNELNCWDLPKAEPFYERVFGWHWDGEPGQYQRASVPLPEGGTRVNAGGMAMPPGVPADVPSHWMTYFLVPDTAAAMARARELGGTIWLAEMSLEQGSFAGLADPTGGMFMVMGGMDTQT